MYKKRILVCGTGFGKIYIKTILEREQYELAGILGRGSSRTKKLAENLGVPIYTDIENLKTDIDAACVIVPNAAGGGNGASIAERLLQKGIPTLLEHPAHEQEIARCFKASKDVPFMLNPFYRYISPVQKFIDAAGIIGQHSGLISASLECAIHVLYDGIDILGCALGNLDAWEMGTVAEMQNMAWANGGNKSVKVAMGNIPIMVTVNTDVDKNDPDHPLHLYHKIELTFSTGRICLVNTHGPVIWMPFQRMPRDPYGTMDTGKDSGNLPSAIPVGDMTAPSLKETFELIWPDAVDRALECLFTQDKKEKAQMARYQIYVSKLWSEISRKVGYLNLIHYSREGSNKEIFEEFLSRGLIKEKP